MRFYELTVIINPTLDDATVQAEIEKVEKFITGSGGRLEKIDRWGGRRMAYEIKGHQTGQYVIFSFESRPGLTSEIEKSLRLNESVIRFMAVVTPGPQKIKPIRIPDEVLIESDDGISLQE